MPAHRRAVRATAAATSVGCRTPLEPVALDPIPEEGRSGDRVVSAGADRSLGGTVQAMATTAGASELSELRVRLYARRLLGLRAAELTGVWVAAVAVLVAGGLSDSLPETADAVAVAVGIVDRVIATGTRDTFEVLLADHPDRRADELADMAALLEG